MSGDVQAIQGAGDFDSWLGRWNVRNRRLRAQLVGSDEWDVFESTVVARPILDGLGNEDEFRIGLDGGFVAMTFRFFDPVSGLWSIYWADSTAPASWILHRSAQSPETPGPSWVKTPLKVVQ